MTILKKTLTKLGITPYALAKRMGIRTQLVYKLVNGQQRLTADLIQKIATALEISPSALIDMETTKPPKRTSTTKSKIQHDSISKTIEVSGEIYLQLQAAGIKLKPEQFKELLHKVHKIFTDAELDKKVLHNVVKASISDIIQQRH